MTQMLVFIVFGLAGIAIHYVKEWVTANNAGKTYDIKKSAPMMVLSVLTTVVLIFLKDDINDIYPITKFSALVLGYTGTSIFFSIIDTKKPKNIPGDNPQP